MPFKVNMRFSVLVIALTCLSTASAAITWSLQKATNPTADQKDAYTRIEAAMRLAVARYGRLSSATKTIRVSYAPGVPTAEANYNGDLRFGSVRSYMNERTAMHEISHTLGIGQTAAFNTRCAANNWPRATPLLQSWDGAGVRINCGGGHICKSIFQSSRSSLGDGPERLLLWNMSKSQDQDTSSLNTWFSGPFHLEDYVTFLYWLRYFNNRAVRFELRYRVEWDQCKPSCSTGCCHDCWRNVEIETSRAFYFLYIFSRRTFVWSTEILQLFENDMISDDLDFSLCFIMTARTILPT